MGAVFAIDKDGKLWSWGNNDAYRLGIGEGGNVNVATPVVGGESGTAQLEDIIDVESCNASTIALKANGTVFIWGYAAESGLGNSVHSGASSSPVQAVKGEGPSPISNKFIETIVDIGVSCIYDNTYSGFGVLTEDGKLYSWGYDNQNYYFSGVLSTEPKKGNVDISLKDICREIGRASCRERV